MDWNTLFTACITGSVVGAVTGLTNWLLNRHILANLERFEEKLKSSKG